MNLCVIDERGAKLKIIVPTDKVIHRMLTFTDAEGTAVNMAAFTDIVFRVNTTPAVTEFSETGGDITVANTNEVTLNFEVTLDAGEYDYTLNGVSAVGEEQKLYGTLQVV